MKFVSLVGARPQFVKAAPVSSCLRRRYTEVLVHSGQHYDDAMSSIFFRELELPVPDYNLGVGSASHAQQTAEILERFDAVLSREEPSCVILYGDTNTTLAGALAASKLNIPIAHVESGLRSFNSQMPEEINRIVTDRCSTFLFCPTESAVEWLAREGMSDNVYLVGDTMYDAVLRVKPHLDERTELLHKLGVARGSYLIVTMHRAENTQDPARVYRVLRCLRSIGEPVVFPMHPRTRTCLSTGGLAKTVDGWSGQIKIIDPVGYLDMLTLLRHARAVLTDSGGLQKEAYFLCTPCLTLRRETEWVETVATGWNQLVGTDCEAMVKAIQECAKPGMAPPRLFGGGRASEAIVEILGSELRVSRR